MIILRKNLPPIMTNKDHPKWDGGNNLESECLICHKKFMTRKCKKRKFCSLKCYFLYRSVNYRGPNHPLWKGENIPRDMAGLRNLHAWVNRYYGKPNICENCGSTKNVEWANVSNKYLRIRSDWKQLCRRCHMMSDGRLKESIKRIILYNKKYV